MSWIRDLPLQNQSAIEYNDHFYRQRLRSLQGVDELVESLVTRLEESGQLGLALDLHSLQEAALPRKCFDDADGLNDLLRQMEPTIRRGQDLTLNTGRYASEP